MNDENVFRVACKKLLRTEKQNGRKKECKKKKIEHLKVKERKNERKKQESQKQRSNRQKEQKERKKEQKERKKEHKERKKVHKEGQFELSNIRAAYVSKRNCVCSFKYPKGRRRRKKVVTGYPILSGTVHLPMDS